VRFILWRPYFSPTGPVEEIQAATGIAETAASVRSILPPPPILPVNGYFFFHHLPQLTRLKRPRKPIRRVGPRHNFPWGSVPREFWINAISRRRNITHKPPLLIRWQTKIVLGTRKVQRPHKEAVGQLLRDLVCGGLAAIAMERSLTLSGSKFPQRACSRQKHRGHDDQQHQNAGHQDERIASTMMFRY
jgi:hypothetical protein